MLRRDRNKTQKEINRKSFDLKTKLNVQRKNKKQLAMRCNDFYLGESCSCFDERGISVIWN